MDKKPPEQLDLEHYANEALRSDGLEECQDCSDDESDKEDPEKTSESDLRVKILLSALESSNSIYKLSLDNENTKKDWRKRFIIFSWTTLSLSLVAVFALVFLDSFKVIQVSPAALVSIFTYIIANLFTALFYMIRYVHNDQYLETFKVVTHKLLDYLLADKNGKN
ncbi:hypothetical protein [Oscillibacter sp. GMB15532]|uniref:hypothetical protein n=1 Tax=Oscillibacter sp. GMB15532 TaxID=3230022 RepID=UPI0034DF3385